MKPKRASKNNGAVSKKGSKKEGKTSSVPPAHGTDGSIQEKLDSINANQEKAAKAAAVAAKLRALEFFTNAAKAISGLAESETAKSLKEWIRDTFNSIPEDLEELLK